jgi:hypothetical protein
VLGDRRDHFQSLKDVWELFRVVLDERKKREIDPTLSIIVASIEEAKKGLAVGGIPIGSVLVCDGQIIGRGHNQRVQHGSVIHHENVSPAAPLPGGYQRELPEAPNEER